MKVLCQLLIQCYVCYSIKTVYAVNTGLALVSLMRQKKKEINWVIQFAD